MSGLDSDALDRWITSGRRQTSLIDVTCHRCGKTTPVRAESEYGATDWDPAECSTCGWEFSGDEEQSDAEPPEPDYPPDPPDYD